MEKITDTRQVLMKNPTMEDIAVVLRRFGDEQSTLLDQYERLSFEVQLNQAILGRSLSEPGGVKGKQPQAIISGRNPPHLVAHERKGRRGLGIGKVLKKLLKPILGRKGGGGSGGGGGGGISRVVKVDPISNGYYDYNYKNPMYCKAFSRSLRI